MPDDDSQGAFGSQGELPPGRSRPGRIPITPKLSGASEEPSLVFAPGVYGFPFSSTRMWEICAPSRSGMSRNAPLKLPAWKWNSSVSVTWSVESAAARPGCSRC